MARGVPRILAVLLLGIALALRIAYVAWQPSVDPAFDRPGLDAGYYLAWAHRIATGADRVEGAFYLAPLYPTMLGTFFRLFGERLVAALLLQQLAVLVAGGLAGAIASRCAGPWAGLATSALFLLYHPILFFSARPVGEAIALLLLVLGVWLAGKGSARCSLLAGLASGLAGLARPNLLLCPLGWGALDGTRRRLRDAALLAAGVSLAVLPVAVRNFAASGHLVPVSSNAGLTLYHGNGPGALGIFNPPDGFSGELARQREEATRLAERQTGRGMDEVEADRYWGGQAIVTRLRDPADTLQLAFRRVLLFVDSYEHGLDDPPMLDRSPFRLTLRLPFPQVGRAEAAPTEIPLVPFGLLVGLSIAGWKLRGVEGTGGAHLWVGIAACAATPILFYASSRYRLPVAALLTVPAGIGCVALLSGARNGRDRAMAGALAGGCALLSLLVPFPSLRRAEEAAALANRASVEHRSGDDAAAEREAERAVAIDPVSTGARFVLALVLERSGRESEAEREYREVLRLDPGHAEAAGNLGGLLIRRGDPAAAVPILRTALGMRPGHGVCWTNLIVALGAAGDLPAAREAALRAAEAGVAIDRELLRTIGAPESQGGTGR